MSDDGGTERDLAQLAKRIVRLMHEHHRDARLSADRVAELLCISRRQMFRALESVQRRFSDVLAQMRIRTAVSLLSDRSISIDEVARLSGFGSDDAFRRRFRELCGCTPSEFRSTRMARTAVVDGPHRRARLARTQP